MFRPDSSTGARALRKREKKTKTSERRRSNYPTLTETAASPAKSTPAWPQHTASAHAFSRYTGNCWLQSLYGPRIPDILCNVHILEFISTASCHVLKPRNGVQIGHLLQVIPVRLPTSCLRYPAEFATRGHVPCAKRNESSRIQELACVLLRYDHLVQLDE